MNRGSTAGFVHLSVYIGFPLFVLAKGRSGQLSTVPWRARGTVGFWATRPVGILFCPAQPRPAAPPCAVPARTARGMFGFCSRQVNIDTPALMDKYVPVESNTRTYHGRVESGRTAGRRGGAGQNGTPTEHFAQLTSVPRTLQGIEDMSPERLRRTNKRNPM